MAGPSLALFLPLSVAAAEPSPGWPDLSLPASSVQPRPQDVALIVAIEDYASLPDLPGAATNGRDWVVYAKQHMWLPDTQLRYLQDGAATRAAIANAAAELAFEVGAEGLFWFVFIGHGLPSCDGQDALLLAADVEPNATSVLGLGLSLGELFDLLEIGQQQRNLLVLDTSFDDRHRSLDMAGCELVPVMPAFKPLIPERSTVLLAARTRQQAGSLLGWDRPAFNYLLLGALRGWADDDGDGNITAPEALGHVRSTLASSQRRQPQQPQILGLEDELVLSHGWESAPGLAGILRQVSRHLVELRHLQLDQAQLDLAAEVERAWAALPAAQADRQAVLADFLSRHGSSRVSAGSMHRWLHLPQVEQARQELVDTGEQEAGAAAEAVGRHNQLTNEMRHLAKRTAWKGVEKAFLDLEELAASEGVVITEEDYLLGAQSGRSLGKIAEVRQRLAAAHALSSNLEVVQWLNDIEQSYGPVRLRSKRSSAVLEADQLPFAPDQRAVINQAAERISSEQEYRGLLPSGIYRFDDELFAVIPGEPELEITLTRER